MHLYTLQVWSKLGLRPEVLKLYHVHRNSQISTLLKIYEDGLKCDSLTQFSDIRVVIFPQQKREDENMFFEYLTYDLSHGEEIVNPLTVDRRLLRGANILFHLAVGEFQKLFRLTPELAKDLISQVDRHLRGSRITPISTEKQVQPFHVLPKGEVCYDPSGTAKEIFERVARMWSVFFDILKQYMYIYTKSIK